MLLFLICDNILVIDEIKIAYFGLFVCFINNNLNWKIKSEMYMWTSHVSLSVTRSIISALRRVVVFAVPTSQFALGRYSPPKNLYCSKDFILTVSRNIWHHSISLTSQTSWCKNYFGANNPVSMTPIYNVSILWSSCRKWRVPYLFLIKYHKF